MNEHEQEAMAAACEALYPPPRNASRVDMIDVARWDAFEAGYRAALDAREPEWTWARLYARLDAALLEHEKTQVNEKLWATYKAVDDDLFGLDREESPESQDGWRLYVLLALFDRRDGSALGDLVQAAREGYERSAPDMREDDAWASFDALWERLTSQERLKLTFAREDTEREHGPEWTWAKLYARLDAALLAHKRAQGNSKADERLWAIHREIDDGLFGVSSE